MPKQRLLPGFSGAWMYVGHHAKRGPKPYEKDVKELHTLWLEDSKLGVRQRMSDKAYPLEIAKKKWRVELKKNEAIKYCGHVQYRILPVVNRGRGFNRLRSVDLVRI